MFGSQLVHAVGRAYVNYVVADEARHQQSRPTNERPVEYGFALRQLAAHRPVTVLDVGTGKSPWPKLLHTSGLVVTAIDNVRDYWPRGMVNRHWAVHDVDITRPNGFTQTFDAITCLSVLEHIHDHVTAMRHMADRLVPGGVLIVTCPYAAHQPHCPDACRHPAAEFVVEHAYVCQSFNAADRRAWEAVGLRVVASEYWQMFTGPYFRNGKPLPWTQVSEDAPHQLGCFAFERA